MNLKSKARALFSKRWAVLTLLWFSLNPSAQAADLPRDDLRRYTEHEVLQALEAAPRGDEGLWVLRAPTRHGVTAWNRTNIPFQLLAGGELSSFDRVRGFDVRSLPTDEQVQLAYPEDLYQGRQDEFALVEEVLEVHLLVRTFNAARYGCSGVPALVDYAEQYVIGEDDERAWEELFKDTPAGAGLRSLLITSAPSLYLHASVLDVYCTAQIWDVEVTVEGLIAGIPDEVASSQGDAFWEELAVKVLLGEDAGAEAVGPADILEFGKRLLFSEEEQDAVDVFLSAWATSRKSALRNELRIVAGDLTHLREVIVFEQSVFQGQLGQGPYAPDFKARSLTALLPDGPGSFRTDGQPSLLLGVGGGFHHGAVSGGEGVDVVSGELGLRLGHTFGPELRWGSTRILTRPYTFADLHLIGSSAEYGGSNGVEVLQLRTEASLRTSVPLGGGLAALVDVGGLQSVWQGWWVYDDEEADGTHHDRATLDPYLGEGVMFGESESRGIVLRTGIQTSQVFPDDIGKPAWRQGGGMVVLVGWEIFKGNRYLVSPDAGSAELGGFLFPGKELDPGAANAMLRLGIEVGI